MDSCYFDYYRISKIRGLLIFVENCRATLCKNMDNFIKIYNTLNIVLYKDGIIVSSSIKQNAIEF